MSSESKPKLNGSSYNIGFALKALDSIEQKISEATEKREINGSPQNMEFAQMNLQDAIEPKISEPKIPEPKISEPKIPEPKISEPKNEASGSGNSFMDAFKAFSKFGDPKSDGEHITLSQSDKWLKQAKVINKKITTIDTGIHFKKLKSQKINFEDYNKFLEDLCKTKKAQISEIKNKMSNCGEPEKIRIKTGNALLKNVDRLTNVKYYTGSHKERFDETGKGKGIAGRKDLKDTSGYVSGYGQKDTYDKTH